MPDILSQSQIDALLQGLNSGEVQSEPQPAASSKKVKEYDFKSPKKFTKEQLRTLSSLHDNFARFISSYLSGFLRVFCEVNILQIEEQRYYEYNNALADSVLIGMVELTPSDENLAESTLLMDMSTSLGYFMIDRLLGGSGDGHDLDRDFTEIELGIMQNVFQKLTNYLTEAWCSYIDVKVSLRNIETNSRLLQVYMPDDTVLIVLMSVKLKNLSGTLSICMPAINLEQIVDNFNTKYMKLEKKKDFDKEEQRKQAILECLTNSDLEMKVVLDELEIDLHDILSLQVNDVIPLTKKISDNAKVLIEDVPWFEGKIGKTKTKKAIKVNRLMM